MTLLAQREPGTGDYVLEMAPTGGTQQTAYLDPHTYLIRKVVASPRPASPGRSAFWRTSESAGEQVPSQLQITYAGLPVVVNATLVERAARREVQPGPVLPARPPRRTSRS